MKPLIGISCDYKDKWSSVRRSYCAAVEAAGGLPVVMPQLDDPDSLRETLERLDGILITGGDDTPPRHYGQRQHKRTVCVSPEREKFDFEILESLKTLDLPVLAICYGAQVMNVSFGGTLHQHIPDLPATKKHHRLPGEERQTHSVTTVPGSLLHRILGVERLSTNSSHHQSIDDSPAPLVQVAFSEDGIVEAVEHANHRFFLGVQWHPEALIDQDLHLMLFKALVAEAAQ